MLSVKFDEISDEGLTLKWTEEKAPLLSYVESFSQIDFDFETPLLAEATVWKANHSVFVKGRIETTLRLRCVRCLNEFFYPLTSTYELTLHPSKGTSLGEEIELDESEMESSFFEEGEIRLSEIACEQIFLEIPYQPLCHEECKGLCPGCGKDLNLFSCECVKEAFGSGFSSLKRLKIES